MKKKLLHRIALWMLFILVLLGAATPAAGAERKACTLWLVTEESPSDEMNAVIMGKINQFQDENPGVIIRMDILPTQQTKREEYLQELRGKMAAGQGPDLFLLPTSTVLTLDHPEKYTYCSIQPLFPDVTAAMENGTFADISNWYDQDQQLGREALNGNIMDAGVVGSARYVLPLRYSARVLYAFDELLDKEGIARETLDENINIILQKAAEARNVSLAECADVTSATAVFSDFVIGGADALSVQQVADYMKRYQAMKARFGTEELQASRFDYMTDTLVVKSMRAVYNDLLCDGIAFLAAGKNAGLTLSMHPQRTTTGDTVAYVTYYGAVGSSCQEPELAYDFLRQFLMDDVQWEQNRDLLDGEWPLSPMEDGWPVRTEGSVAALWANVSDRISNGKLSGIQLTDDDLPILQFPFDLVCFPVDTELGSFLAQLNDAENGGAPTDADISALAAAYLGNL